MTVTKLAELPHILFGGVIVDILEVHGELAIQAMTRDALTIRCYFVHFAHRLVSRYIDAGLRQLG